jgi:hypothetical protein
MAATTNPSPSDRAAREGSAEVPIELNGFAAVPAAAATLAGRLIRRPGLLRGLTAKLGSQAAGTTTVQVHKNGVSQASVSFVFGTDANGVVKSGGVNPPVSVGSGDTIELVSSAVGTTPVDLGAYADMVETYGS